jgi:hypothetical protein
MKLLSTIAFLLLTFSAFSQEKLSYQDGVIKQGEEVLSLEELSVLVNGADITYTKGLSTRHFKFDAEKTERLRLAGDNKKAARALNANARLGTAVGAAAGITGIIVLSAGVLLNASEALYYLANGAASTSAMEGPALVAKGEAMAALGFVLAGSSIAKIRTSAKFGQRAEESIYEAVTLYNASLLEAQ